MANRTAKCAFAIFASVFASTPVTIVASSSARPTQHQRLRELGCDYAQGFLLARPMTA